MNDLVGSTIKFKGGFFSAAKSAAKFSYDLNKGCKGAFRKTVAAFFTRKVSIPSETSDKSYLKKASDLVSKCDNKGIACRVITPYGFDNLAKRGEAQAFVNQCVIRTWPYKNVSHPGHAALSIKSGENEEYSHSYVSWWASDESEPGVANTKSGTKGELFNRVYGYSQINYLQDKYCEMSDRARGKLAAAKNALERIKSGNFNKADLDEASIDLRERQKELPKWGGDAFGVSADKVYIPPQGFNRNKKTGDATFFMFGLDREAMESEWTKVQKMEMDGVASYRMISNKDNCAGMVLRVLKKGGADVYIDNHKLSSFVNTSNNVHRYAIQLQQIIDRLNSSANELLSRFEALDEEERLRLSRSFPMPGHTAMHIAEQAGLIKNSEDKVLLKRIEKCLYQIDRGKNKVDLMKSSVRLVESIEKLRADEKYNGLGDVLCYAVDQTTRQIMRCGFDN